MLTAVFSGDERSYYIGLARLVVGSDTSPGGGFADAAG